MSTVCFGSRFLRTAIPLDWTSQQLGSEAQHIYDPNKPPVEELAAYYSYDFSDEGGGGYDNYGEGRGSRKRRKNKRDTHGGGGYDDYGGYDNYGDHDTTIMGTMIFMGTMIMMGIITMMPPEAMIGMGNEQCCTTTVVF